MYRRYRPENFAEMIGQSQVTDPLMTALRSDRIGHAYLFSGPRGCGKTTSARILARCLNCAQGPTDTPCGTCDSCVELSRAGGGSLDVVEIDAASHNGVDDARDLRERAVFAPARDRFKIFILDEAHMVTAQGFNALLKLVEEPPAHVKFIFATTEPEKVIGTIRSRTHHYPFRLVPPAAMLTYVESLCQQEGTIAEQGVLPLVVRAGAGSPRDTLSILDQLIAGSEGDTVSYSRAVALLGYTHGELLDEVTDAFASGDAAGAFAAVDRVVQTGQDPRRFVDDLLERLRDLIVIAATGAQASQVLRGLPADELERMQQQARIYGTARLSRTADIVSSALDQMVGATSPRLQLELMIARVLTADTAPSAPVASNAESRTVAPAPREAAAVAAPEPRAEPAAPAAQPSVAAPPVASPVAAPPVAAPAAAPVTAPPVAAPTAPPAAAPAPVTDAAPTPPVEPLVVAPGNPAEDDVPAAGWAAQQAQTASPDASDAAVSSTETHPGADASPSVAPANENASAASPESEAPALTLDGLRQAWPRVIAVLESANRSSWLVMQSASAAHVGGDVVGLAFTNQSDLGRFKTRAADGSGVSEDLRAAIENVLGQRVKFLAKHIPTLDSPPAADVPPAEPEPEPEADQPPAPPETSSYHSAPVTGWATAPIPRNEQADTASESAPTDAPESVPPASESVSAADADAAAPQEALAPPTQPAAAPAAASTPSATVDGPPAAASAALPPRQTAAAPPPFPSSVAAPGIHQVGPSDDDIPPEPEDEPPYPDIEPTRPVGPTVQSRQIRLDEGIERYGEAVVRQKLGARFLHEETYEPPTRFQ
nr:DNA polymerase III subunit gamma and tau [Microbacterium amylolyticum]